MKGLAKNTIAIASGKGGVGKTVTTANLALSLAQRAPSQDRPLIAIDLDIGCGNLNSCLGVRSPNGTINSFFNNQVSSLEQVLTPTAQDNLKMVSASYSGLPEPELSDDLIQTLVDEIGSFNTPYLLMDLGAGTSNRVVDLFLSATQRIVVVAPEALSLHNAFVFLKTALLRFLWRELDREDFLGPVKSTLKKLVANQETLDIPLLIEKLKKWYRYSAYVLSGLIDDLKIKFIVNMYRGGEERSHLLRFHDLLFKYLNVRTNISYLGFVHFDRGIRNSVQNIEPFLLHYPRNRAAGDFLRLAQRLEKQETLSTIPQLQFPEHRGWLPTFLRDL